MHSPDNDPGRGDQSWWRDTPPALVPVPAAEAPGPLLERRAIIGHPRGLGFVVDMRIGSEPHVSSTGQTLIAVLSEHEFYRAVLTGEEAVCRACRIDQVWVEQEVDLPDLSHHDDEVDSVSAGDDGQLDAEPDLGSPPIRWPQRPHQRATPLVGRRVVVMQPSGPLWDQRLLSEPTQRRGLGEVAACCSERDYYDWQLHGRSPRADFVPLAQLWVE
jgi:hypothetical protein